jgi:hypothetical protein
MALTACSGAPFDVAPEGGTPFALGTNRPEWATSDAGDALSERADVPSSDAALFTPDASPLDGGPSQDSQAEAEPIEAEPIEAGPIEAGPIEAGPIEAGPAEAGVADVEVPDASSSKLCCTFDSCTSGPLACDPRGSGYACFDEHGQESNTCRASSCVLGATCLPSGPSDCTGLGTVRGCP